MAKDPSVYLREPYSRILVPNEDGTYSAEILEFPGCFADGDAPDEAMRALEEAAKSWIQAALEQGQTIPEPESNQGYSGHFLLRLPRGLHRMAARMAAHDQTSLNQFIASAVAARVGAEDLLKRLTDQFHPIRVANILVVSEKLFSSRQAATTDLVEDFRVPKALAAPVFSSGEVSNA